MTRARSLALVAVAYVVAIAAAAGWLAWGPATGKLWLDTLVADVLATLVVFAFSRWYRNSSFDDAFWSVIPPLLTFYRRSQPDAPQLRCRLVALPVRSVRLTANWIRAFPGLHHEDWRYGMFREPRGRSEFVVDLVAIHLIPPVQVFAGMLAVYVCVTRAGNDISWLTAVAFVVGVVAVALESVTDVEAHGFIRDRQPGEVMDRGLWQWSRHPNYFGGFGFWVALTLFGVAASPADAWWLFAGPPAMPARFLGASVPMMEKRSLQRRPDYQRVIDRLSGFIPLPPHKMAT